MTGLPPTSIFGWQASAPGLLRPLLLAKAWPQWLTDGGGSPRGDKRGAQGWEQSRGLTMEGGGWVQQAPIRGSGSNPSSSTWSKHP